MFRWIAVQTQIPRVIMQGAKIPTVPRNWGSGFHAGSDVGSSGETGSPRAHGMKVETTVLSTAKGGGAGLPEKKC